jgi:hypothetical protein
MDSKSLLWGDKVSPDYELYTPTYIVEAIVPHLLEYQNKVGKDITVWCPFSTDTDMQFDKGTLLKSEYVNILSKYFNVVCSHILTGQDFFEYEPEHWDIIVDNPPFQKKSEFFKRALLLDKPFLLLMTMAVFNDRNPIGLFNDYNKDVQVLKFNQRAKYIKPNGLIENKVTFSSGYIGHSILKSNLIVEDIQVPTPTEIRRLNESRSK